MNLKKLGITALASGARKGNSSFAGLGAGLVLIGWLRQRARPKKELLWSKTLRPGQAVRIRHLGTGDEVEIEG